MDLQSEDPRIYSKEIQINRTCSGFCLFGSPIRGVMDLHSDSNVYCKLNYKNKSPLWRSMDSMIGDPKKENPYNKNVCLDLHSEDPWIFLKEIQINRYQIVDMFIHILTFRVLFIWISIQGIHGST